MMKVLTSEPETELAQASVRLLIQVRFASEGVVTPCEPN